jgi:hypothetical protein
MLDGFDGLGIEVGSSGVLDDDVGDRGIGGDRES